MIVEFLTRGQVQDTPLAIWQLIQIGQSQLDLLGQHCGSFDRHRLAWHAFHGMATRYFSTNDFTTQDIEPHISCNGVQPSFETPTTTSFSLRCERTQHRFLSNIFRPFAIRLCEPHCKPVDTIQMVKELLVALALVRQS